MTFSSINIEENVNNYKELVIINFNRIKINNNFINIASNKKYKFANISGNNILFYKNYLRKELKEKINIKFKKYILKNKINLSEFEAENIDFAPKSMQTLLLFK